MNTANEMKVELIKRRRNGFLLDRRDWGLPVVGELVIDQDWVTETKCRPAAILRTPDSSRSDAVITRLYDPSVKSLQGMSMVITGWEITEHPGHGRQITLQEWICSVI